ncbi:MAG TPA: transcriptional regulator [Methanomassiliicoccales archaeon]|jgi:DNA-binding transcriptional ArsR family regulator
MKGDPTKSDSERKEDDLYSSFSGIDRVIHEPSRMHIMVVLSEVDTADYAFLMNQTGMTWGNISSHLSKLETAGYVRIDKEFVGKKPHTLVSITDEGKNQLRRYRFEMDGLLKAIEMKGRPVHPHGD